MRSLYTFLLASAVLAVQAADLVAQATPQGAPSQAPASLPTAPAVTPVDCVKEINQITQKMAADAKASWKQPDMAAIGDTMRYRAHALTTIVGQLVDAPAASAGR